MANYTEEQLQILREKREDPSNNRRAHFLCACGCPVAEENETCPNCGFIGVYTQFGIKILDYKREEKRKRYEIKK